MPVHGTISTAAIPGRESLPRWKYGDSPDGVDGIFTTKNTGHSRSRLLTALNPSDKALQDLEPIFQNTFNALISSFCTRSSHSNA